MDRLKRLLRDCFSIENMTLKAMPMLLSISVALTMLYIHYVKHYKRYLTKFYDRAIGQTSINGIDAPVRLPTFWLSLTILVVSFAIMNYIFNRVKNRLSSKLSNDFLSLEGTVFFELGMLILINLVIFYDSVLRDQIDTMMLKLLFLLAVAVIVTGLHTFIKILDAKNGLQYNALNAALSFLFPVPLTYFVLLVASFNSPTVSVYTINALCVYVILFLVMQHFMKKMLKPIPMAYALIPISFIPFAYIAGNETQYTLTKYGVLFSPKIIALVFSAVLLIIGSLVYVKKRIVIEEKCAIRIIENVIVPVLLVTLGLFAYQAQVWTIYDVDIGNRILPAQQLYQFGKLPILEIVHHQQFPIGAFVYMLINGNNLMEPIIWNSLANIIILVLIGYFVLRQFLSARWVALLLCFTPILNYANPYYITGLLPLVYLKQMRKHRNFKHYLVFLLLSLVAFAYHLASGKIAVLSCAVILCLSCSNKKEITQAAKALMTVFIPPVVIGFTILIIKGENISDWLIMLISFGKADILSGSYTSFIGDWRSAFEAILYYGLFPLTCVICAILVLIRKEKNNLTFCYIYLSAANIVCSLRSFARHSQMELLPIDFYVLLFILVPCIFIADKVFRKMAIVLIMLIFMLIPYTSLPINNVYAGTPYMTGPMDNTLAVVGVKEFTFRQFEVGEVRYDPKNDARYPHDLRKIFDTVLEGGQTFLDCCYGNKLYTLMEKECIFMLNVTMTIQFEAPQEALVRKLEKLYEQSKIPLVLYYKQGYNQMDGVPIELSLFKLAEFVNTHYEPWIIVYNAFHLWKAKNSGMKLLDDELILYENGSTVQQNYDMIMLPYIWGNYDEKVKAHFPEELFRIADYRALNAGEVMNLPLSKDIDKSSGNYIYLRIDSPESGEFMLFYGDDIINSCKFNVVAGEYDYLVRISSQYNWMAKEQTSINIVSTVPVFLQRVSVLKGD